MSQNYSSLKVLFPNIMSYYYCRPLGWKEIVYFTK